MQNRLFLNAVGLTVAASAAVVPLAAGAAALSGTLTAPGADRGAITALTSRNWDRIAQRAVAAGDDEGADVSRTMSRITAAGGPETIDRRNIWTTIAKKAVIQVLRYATDKLPAKVRPYASKIINVVEDLDQFQEKAVVIALTQAGVPYDVAVAAAQWIVVFVGL